MLEVYDIHSQSSSQSHWTQSASGLHLKNIKLHRQDIFNCGMPLISYIEYMCVCVVASIGHVNACNRAPTSALVNVKLSNITTLKCCKLFNVKLIFLVLKLCHHILEGKVTLPLPPKNRHLDIGGLIQGGYLTRHSLYINAYQ